MLSKQITDSHCCIISFLILIIVVTGIFLANMISVEIKYNASENMKNSLRIDTDYANISRESIASYLKDVIGRHFFNSTLNEPKFGIFLRNYQVIGNVRLRFQQNKLSECSIYALESQQFACFDINGPTPLTDSILDSSNYEFQIHQEGPTDTSQQYSLPGYFYTYSPEGYFLDFSPAENREQYGYTIDKFWNQMGYSDNLRVIIFTASLYNPNIDTWITMNLIFERDPFGNISPAEPLFYFYRPNIYDGIYGEQMIVLDILRLISAGLLLVFVIARVIQSNSMLYLFTLYGLLNCLVIGLSFASLVYSLLHYLNNFKENDLLELLQKSIDELKTKDIFTLNFPDFIQYQNKYFVDLSNSGQLYTTLQSLQSVLITILLFRLILVCSFSNHIKLVVETIKTAGYDLLKYYVIFLPLIFSFAFIFYQIWGEQVEDYTNLKTSLCQIMLMTIGYFKIDQIQQVGSVSSIVYLILFYLLVIFLFFNFTIGILIESYKSYIMMKGYPEMGESPLTGSLIFSWIFQWIPESYKDKIKDIFNTIKNQIQNHDQSSDQDSSSEEKKPLLYKSSMKKPMSVD